MGGVNNMGSHVHSWDDWRNDPYGRGIVNHHHYEHYSGVILVRVRGPVSTKCFTRLTPTAYRIIDGVKMPLEANHAWNDEGELDDPEPYWNILGVIE